MTFLEFRRTFQNYTIFSVNEIRKIDPVFHRARLNDWQDKGYITKIRKGYYIFSDLDIDEGVLFEIANRIHSPSYVSLEMALSYYHLIPESVYAITSVCSRKPFRYQTPVGIFIYRKIKPILFFGYEVVEHRKKQFKIATPEKTILDYFYINPHLRSPDDFASLRIDVDVFDERIDVGRLRRFLQKFGQKSLEKRIDSFLDFLHYDRLTADRKVLPGTVSRD